MQIKYIGLAVMLLPVLLSACESRAERQFKKGCMMGGADRSTCSCVYDKMKDHYSADLMEHMGEPGTQMPADFPDVMVKTALQCRNEN